MAGNHEEETEMIFPTIIKNMLLFLLIFGAGFSIGSFCGFKASEAEGLVGWSIEETVDLEDWK